ncbi:unnamed protein product [Paramecium primaurelia]|uniref:C3H1-type domain-containing protein n=1 Tax=Paramecium primaurelia TaxID=5886 RepID=A0A8S1K3F7_PARPR|nr:unnamed protein product [Paramecium primaurelia]
MSYQFGGSQLQQQNVPNAKYKTMLCRHYQATKQCAIGNKCQFAHGTQEQRQINDPLPASALSAMATVIEQPQNKPQPPIFQSIAQIINILFLVNTMPKIIVKMAKIVNIFTTPIQFNSNQYHLHNKHSCPHLLLK